LRSFRRCSFSASVVARGRTYRFGGREITDGGTGDGVENVVEGIRGGGGMGAEFGDVDIYADVEEEEGGMRRECGLTVDGMSDATFILFPQSILGAKLCAIVVACRRLVSHGGEGKRAVGSSNVQENYPLLCLVHVL